MKRTEFKNLIKEACREALIELLTQQSTPTVKQPIKENFNFNTNDISRDTIRDKFGEMIGFQTMKPSTQVEAPRNQIAASVVEKIPDTNPFKNILAQTANELQPGDLSNLKNLSE